MPGTRITLDNPAFAGRLKTHSRRSIYERRAVMFRSRTISDVRTETYPKHQQVTKARSTGIVVPHRSRPKPTPGRQMRSQVLMRQLVGGHQVRRSRRRLNAKGMVLTVLASILFVFGAGVGVLQLHTNQKVKAQVQTLAAHVDSATDEGDGNSADSTTDVPSEKKPSGTAVYHTAPDIPRTLSIPKLDVNARVLRMGVLANGEVKTPNNIYDTGWFENSAKPGEQGAVFIDGHVHGPTIPGVFVGLKKLQAGDKITITTGDGRKFNYHVVKSQTYDRNNVDMGAALNTIVPGKPGLNLITCTGSFSTQSSEYDKRIIVFAVQD